MAKSEHGLDSRSGFFAYLLAAFPRTSERARRRALFVRVLSVRKVTQVGGDARCVEDAAAASRWRKRQVTIQVSRSAAAIAAEPAPERRGVFTRDIVSGAEVDGEVREVPALLLPAGHDVLVIGRRAAEPHARCSLPIGRVRAAVSEDGLKEGTAQTPPRLVPVPPGECRGRCIICARVLDMRRLRRGAGERARGMRVGSLPRGPSEGVRVVAAVVVPDEGRSGLRRRAHKVVAVLDVGVGVALELERTTLRYTISDWELARRMSTRMISRNESTHLHAAARPSHSWIDRGTLGVPAGPVGPPDLDLPPDLAAGAILQRVISLWDCGILQSASDLRVVQRVAHAKRSRKVRAGCIHGYQRFRKKLRKNKAGTICTALADNRALQEPYVTAFSATHRKWLGKGRRDGQKADDGVGGLGEQPNAEIDDASNDQHGDAAAIPYYALPLQLPPRNTGFSTVASEETAEKVGSKTARAVSGGDRNSSWTINRASTFMAAKAATAASGDGGVGQGPVFERPFGYKLAPLAEPAMAVELFCTAHSLKEDIKDLLVDQGFATAGDLYHVKETDLEDAGFKVGHISGLKKALDSAPKAPC
ncbi:hypothetical protein K438DRAFT_1774426 [Mycena galopus ATCC 62051]|nr:hypothetical protein K438DRAFT_1774426 [Mycena galopus ATCC 62051]